MARKRLRPEDERALQEWEEVMRLLLRTESIEPGETMLEAVSRLLYEDQEPRSMTGPVVSLEEWRSRRNHPAQGKR